MATDDVLIRDAHLDEAPAMLEVITAAFPRWPAQETTTSALAHLRWKMAPEAGLPTLHTVATVDGRIAATRLRWVNRVMIDGREYLQETGADFAVHPDFQGRGISRAIREHFHEELKRDPRPGISMLTKSPQVRYMTSELLVPRKLTVWHRPLGRGQAALAQLRRPTPHTVGRAIRAAVSRPHLPEGTVTTLERFDERTDRLWERARPAFDIVTDRSAAYLNWRFAQPAAGPATILACLDADEVLAYAVVKRADDVGQLVDLLWDPAHPSALGNVVSAALDHARVSGARAIICWLPTVHPATRVMRDLGFLAVATDEVLLGNGDEGETQPELLEIFQDPARSLHVTMSDFDYF